MGHVSCILHTLAALIVHYDADSHIRMIRLISRGIIVAASVGQLHDLLFQSQLFLMRKSWRVAMITAAVVLPLGVYQLKTKQGRAWSWGSGRNGELGLGQETNNPLPRTINNLNFVSISAGKHISAGITADKKLYTWGKNRNGLLGHQPPNLNVLIPSEVGHIEDVVQVCCGYQHICAVAENGEAYVWGINQVTSKFREIGINQTTRKTLSEVKPYKINLKNIKQASCAGDYITLVDKEGKVFVMGPSRVTGKENKQAKYQTDIIELEFQEPIQRVESGLNFSLALNQEGRVYAWGNNTFGQLGIGSLKNLSQPFLLQVLLREKVTDISCGDNFAGVVTENGDVYTWGFGNQGQLGHGDKSDQFLPRKINVEHKVKQISCGGAHTALLTKNNQLFMMGRGREGQLGREQKDEGSSGYSLQLKPVEQLPAHTISNVSCGSTHTLVLLQDKV